MCKHIQKENEIVVISIISREIYKHLYETTYRKRSSSILCYANRDLETFICENIYKKNKTTVISVTKIEI